MAASTKRRMLASLAMSLGILAFATGCNVVQGQRPDPKVMVLTVESGVVTFMWCGDDSQFDTFWIQSRQNNEESVVVTDGEGSFQLSRGQTFTAETPPEGPDYSRQGPISIADGSSIYVGTLSNGSSGSSYRSAFNNVDLQSLPDGAWVTGDGKITQEPCT